MSSILKSCKAPPFKQPARDTVRGGRGFGALLAGVLVGGIAVELLRPRETTTTVVMPAPSRTTTASYRMAETLEEQAYCLQATRGVTRFCALPVRLSLL